MFVIPTTALLLLFVYFRPHEIFETLKPLNFNLIAVLLGWGYVMDARLGFVRPRVTALFWLGTSFLVWALITHAIKASPSIGVAIPTLGASILIFVIISLGLPNFRAIEVTAAVLLAITLVIASIGVEQALSPLMCIRYSPFTRSTVSDGRPCTDPTEPDECRRGGSPDVRYLCEHPGAANTFSIQGRVRYRGILQDPNELAWAVCMGAPLAFALYGRKRSLFRLLLVIAMLSLGAVCVIKTQSRSGQLTFAAMLGVYFIARYKWKGVVVGLFAGLPVMLLGGRSGDSAAESTEERLECWRQGFKMWQSDPFIGVGHAQFVEHHYLTAHSSLVLTLAELGPLGLFLFTGIVYYAFKIALRAQIRYGDSEQAAVAKTWSTAILASLAGTVVSALFLSIPYHPILWVDMGLVGALYAAIRTHDPDFHVPFGWRDAGLVFVGDILIVVGLKTYLAIHSP
jgi:hypothetical protein